MGLAQHTAQRRRNILRREDVPPDGVVDVMVEIGDPVGIMDDAPFHGVGFFLAGVAQNSIPHLHSQVQALTALFQPVHHPQALLVVGKAPGHHLPQRLFSGVAEGGVPQVMAQGDGLGQVLVEPQAPGHRAGDLGDLQGMGQPGAVMVPFRGQKHLGFVFQPAECLGMDDPVPIPHKTGAAGGFLLGRGPAPGCACQTSPFLQSALFQLFQSFSYHRASPPFI